MARGYRSEMTALKPRSADAFAAHGPLRSARRRTTSTAHRDNRTMRGELRLPSGSGHQIQWTAHGVAATQRIRLQRLPLPRHRP